MYLVIKWCCKWWLIFVILCFVSLIKYCDKLCIQRQMVVQWRHVSYLLYGKYWKTNYFVPPSTLTFHWIKLENLVMQLKRHPVQVEAWLMKSIIQKRIIPVRTQSQDEKFPQYLSMAFNWSLKAVDHMKYEGQVRSQHLLFVQFSRWAFKLSCYCDKSSLF